MPSELGAEEWESAGSSKGTRPLYQGDPWELSSNYLLNPIPNKPGSYLFFDTSVIEKERNKSERPSIRKLVRWWKLGSLDLFSMLEGLKASARA